MTRIVLVVLVALGAFVTDDPAPPCGPPLVCHPLEIGAARSLPWKGGAFGTDSAFGRERVPAETVAILAESNDAVVHMETLRRAYLYLGIGSDHPALASLGGLLKDRILEVSTADADHTSRVRAPEALAWFDLGYLMAIIESNGGPPLFGDRRSPRFLDHAAAMVPESPDVQAGVGWGLAGNGIARGEKLIERALQLATRPESLVVKNFGRTTSPASRPALDPISTRRNQTIFISKLGQAKTALDHGVAFFDARAKADFAAGHVKGAISLDATDQTIVAVTTAPSVLESVDRHARVIVYDDGGDCDAAQLIAAQMRKFGFMDVSVFEEGFAAWKAKGHPIDPE